MLKPGWDQGFSFYCPDQMLAAMVLTYPLTIFHMNIEGFIASKMIVLYYLVLQLEALIILLQEICCSSTEKLIPV